MVPNRKKRNGTWCGFEVGTFINSCNRRIFVQGLDREVFNNQIISVNYFFGAMEGYRGECNMRKDLGPVFGHDPGPVAALKLRLYLQKHFSLNLLTYGVGIIAGADYVF